MEIAMAATARLFINGKDVGTVEVKSLADSWGFGDFSPNAAFEEFAVIFGNWSLLMHADDEEKKLSEAASEELRQAEYAIDSLRAKLLITATNEWLDVSQINIDGPLVEWKVTQRHSSPPPRAGDQAARE
jgi:hypothetical protein